MYQRNYMEDQEEQEIENLETENELNREEPELNKEELTWKKRYGDLRRLDQQKDSTIRELKSQLDQSTKKGLNVPNADDEAALEEWAQAYPDIARVVTTLANRQARAQLEAVDQKVKAFEEDKQREAVLTAQRKLSEAHPDFFDKIRIDPDFEEWIAGKSKRMQDALYSDESVTDWQSAADVISMYKLERGIIETKKKKDATDSRRQAASDIPSRGTQRPNDGKQYLFTESEIGKMPYHVYEQNEEKITAALREGRVLMDVTGGAR